LLQNGDAQSVVNLKGVDENFNKVSGVPARVTSGIYSIGNAD
jgi:hypothetical protein